jgi:hypothetical protein
MGRVSRTQAKKPSSSTATTAAERFSGDDDGDMAVMARSSQTRPAGTETMASMPAR